MHVASWIWVLIPLAAIFAGLMKRLFQLKEKGLEIMGRNAHEKGAEYAAQTERLEQRVRVLERIVTDKGIDVAEEIEKLRDKPLN